MRLRMLSTLACAAALLFLAPSGFGQILNPRVTISGTASVMKGERNFTVNTDAFKSELVNGGKMTARLTLDLTKHFSIEGEYAFSRNNLRITDLGGTPQEHGFGIRGHQVQVNILHFFTGSDSTIRPFLTTGVGLVRFSPTDQAKAEALAMNFIEDPAQISSVDKVGVTFGGGIEAHAISWLGLRFDVRDRITAYPRFGLPQSSSGTGAAFFPVDGIVHNVEAGVGLVIYLFR